jgi:hypothetical protein
MKRAIVVYFLIYAVLVSLGATRIVSRSSAPEEYTAKRALPENHRLVEADLNVPTLAQHGFGFGIDAPSAFVGKYLDRYTEASEPVRPADLMSTPMLVSHPGYVSYWHALNTEPLSLSSILDADDLVDLCAIGKNCVENVRVEAIACGDASVACDVILQLPVKDLASLVRDKRDAGVTIYLR